MRPIRSFHVLSPELLFGVFHSLLWLLLALQVSAGVLTPLAKSLDVLRPVSAAVQ
jgi:hypothetical protein